MYKVRSFGNDCLGNISGYLVERYEWVAQEWSGRSDGLCLEQNIAGKFVGDIYKPGSFGTALAEAQTLAASLNKARQNGRIPT